MTIQNTLLVGNGVNRIEVDSDDEVSWSISWESALQELADKVGYPLRNINEKPLTLVFDEILTNSPRLSRFDLQKMMAHASFRSSNNELSNVLSCLSKDILTTNYQSSIPISNGFSPDHLGFELNLPLFPEIKENTFSLFRGRKTRGKTFWQIHGEYLTPTSITLGYRQYARYQANIYNYLLSGAHYQKLKTLNSPLYRSIPIFDFEKKTDHYSWVDLFLRDHIHVVGLGLDYSESILWWLITEKFHLQKKFPKYIGGLTFHQVSIDGKLPISVDEKLNMLEDLGVKVHVVDTATYKEGYLQIADVIKPGIRSLYEKNNLKEMYKLSLK